MNSEPEFSRLSPVHKGIQQTRTSQEDKKLLSKQIKRARMRSDYHHQISGTHNNIDICVYFSCGQWLVSEEDYKNFPAKKTHFDIMIPMRLQCTYTTESFNSFYAASPWLFKDQQQTQATVHYSFHCMCNLMNRYSRELNRAITVWNYSGPVYVGEYQNSTALMTVFRIRLPTVYWTALWRNVKGRWNSEGTVIGVRTMKTSMFKLGMS